jgi:hypothetical protein
LCSLNSVYNILIVLFHFIRSTYLNTYETIYHLIAYLIYFVFNFKKDAYLKFIQSYYDFMRYNLDNFVCDISWNNRQDGPWALN